MYGFVMLRYGIRVRERHSAFFAFERFLLEMNRVDVYRQRVPLAERFAAVMALVMDIFHVGVTLFFIVEHETAFDAWSDRASVGTNQYVGAIPLNVNVSAAGIQEGFAAFIAGQDDSSLMIDHGVSIKLIDSFELLAAYFTRAMR